MDFKKAVEQLLNECEAAGFAVAMWRTQQGLNCFVKGSEFEIIGAAEYLADLMKMAVAQKTTQHNRGSIVIPRAKMI